MAQVTLTINDRKVTVDEKSTVLDAARQLNVKIPTLCHLNLHDLKINHTNASCRICMVEIDGRRNLAPSCATPVVEGMVIRTHTKRVLKSRRKVLELLVSDHPFDCLNCYKSTDCELQTLVNEFGINKNTYEGFAMSQYPVDESSKAIRRDLTKCIMCRRCETVCNNVQTVGVLTGYKRGFEAVVAPAEMKGIVDTKCTYCGQCVAVCPTAALTGISYIQDVWNAIFDDKKTVIVQTAPAIRVAIGEEFGMQPGEIVTGKLVAGLRRMGFDSVFDTNFGADLTIMEESAELIERVVKNKDLPILTSCCPGWINFLEYQFPDLLNIPSTCKSPQQMFGAIAKSYYAEKIGKKPEEIVVVSIMPCIAKKYEASRPEFAPNNVPDVDFALTTRELAKMFKEAGLDLNDLPEEQFDSPLGESTGAADIFASSGGVLEAALRTAYEKMTGKKLDKVDFVSVRGMEGVKEVTIDIGGTPLNFAITSGLGNARIVLEKIRSGESKYHGIEIMACPGGCINGGGQPFIHGDSSIIEKRMNAIYKEDSGKKLRKSHDNPSIQKLYKEYLGEPLGHKSHELLHTEYYKKHGS
ncbi:MAG: NADH:ubiquinone oxidoreductase [Spirochaetes bacterium GWF1_31_7]|nr:MAG: NADH:ubiquinone oxidoreductase [Spirochaetes bacterium GWE1_32_154]OHD48241.1 MAG: NADH:ubiquinone oxidoreductase [Spirochaetes bacterium GWE2_31_10]OHD50644.1 MAG: NADH:ubiquinone oxidoreductase [Spirochaetes bacterium GWF1_31_7]HBD96509.1 NADH:ubiquinone oxidoreductase [Spirochaetia bacterium]HBI37691.1 NADH:ubiquinone oxidoreductase [Spirochaetia bacterium]